MRGRGIRWAVVAFALCFGIPVAAQSATDVFPMAIGTSWEYRGEVRWEGEHGKIFSEPLEWKTQVVDFARHHGTSIALLRGAPMDLAGWHPGDDQHYSLLIHRGRTFYFRSAPEAPEFFLKFKHHPIWPFHRPPPKGSPIRPEDAWFSVPLATGQKTCAPSQAARQDAMYCWTVDTKAPAELGGAQGIPPGNRVEFSLAYRTAPDHEIVGLAPGIGIVEYEYQHHGTVAEAKIKLVKFYRVQVPR